MAADMIEKGLHEDWWATDHPSDTPPEDLVETPPARIVRGAGDVCDVCGVEWSVVEGLSCDCQIDARRSREAQLSQQDGSNG
jgi:hypothetical protein